MMELNDFIEVDNEAKGNCLFEAVSRRLFGSNYEHGTVRRDTMDYIEKHKEDFESFIADTTNNKDFEKYVSGMRQDLEWGSMVELQAMSNLYNTNIALYYDTSPIANITIAPHNDTNTAQLIRLHYVNGVHCTAIVPKNDGNSLFFFVPLLINKNICTISLPYI